MNSIIGREEEKAIFMEALNSEEPELIAVYGRRRVGKTFLIRNVFQKQLLFEFSGIHHAPNEQQLESFSLALTSASGSPVPFAIPANWLQAFKMLTDYITPLIKRKKAVLFFDEFPWINVHKSGFLPAFENFWNAWGTRQKNIIVVICGSAAAWMIQKVVHNRGGLHNRLTRKMRLLPFTLQETESYLQTRRINLDRYQLLQLYMVMGGIPHYLKEIKPGQSAAQSIDRLCFTDSGLLQNEFKDLYLSLFDNATNHIAVIRALAHHGAGLTRSEIIEICQLTSGGGTTQLLEELLESGFIAVYTTFDKNIKEGIYKLTDEYSHFYIKFIEGSQAKGAGTWIKFSKGGSWKSWSGFAFERACLKHAQQLKNALHIGGVYSEESAWRYTPKKDEKGAQIDLLIDRQDFCINICEMKFSIAEFVIDKQYAGELENKIKIFRENAKTRKTLFLTMVTTFGVKTNEHKIRLVQNEITMDALFR